ncbi:MAG: hypothetical protein A2X86_21200 [Bdellovibrionales bacterium GWA2_49_15]|nr:MAG: hypothetical protein A2X86_21200 [Bdellovibrionales bacterium GWA2_49_15]HAZ14896.1 hypothetical protein [Bdellovibrionales bacterium]
MKTILSKVFLVAISLCFLCSPSWSFDSTCSRPTDLSCEYYSRCVENYLACGADGYSIGYGKRYCQRFLDTSYSTYQGDLWRDETLLCLQRELSLFVFFSPYEIKSCSTIKKYAYETHANCYVRPNRGRPELSICYLSPLDVKLTTQNLRAVDVLRWNGLKQMAQVAKLCLELLNNGKASLSSVSVEDQKDFWKSMFTAP